MVMLLLVGEGWLVWTQAQTSLSADDGSLRVEGMVLAEDGSRVPYARVHLEGIGSGGEVLWRASTFADSVGRFGFSGVRPGVYRLVVDAPGYARYVRERVVVSGGVFIEVRLAAEVRTLASVQVRPRVHSEFSARASTYPFSVERTERYAGSRGDPARMAGILPGVIINNDASNDLIVRGNSPLGVQWYLEGVAIPNPNHFGVPGARGGPLSMLDPQMLGSSWFYAGGFPSRYGNSVAGVFALRFRTGDLHRWHAMVEPSFLGMRVQVEGPIVRGRTSLLASYRYSTVAIFHWLGIDIGTDAVPRYQDFAWNVKGGKWQWWGVVGNSAIDILQSQKTDPEDVDLYGTYGLDEYYRTAMGASGLGWQWVRRKGHRVQSTLVVSYEMQSNHQIRVFRHVEQGRFVIDSFRDFLLYRFAYSRIGLWTEGKHPAGFVGKDLWLRWGIQPDLYFGNLYDSIYREGLGGFEVRQAFRGCFGLVQGYVEMGGLLWRRWTVQAGGHALFFTLSGNHFAVDPRLRLTYRVDSAWTLTFATGIYTQTLPFYLYTARQLTDTGYIFPNRRVAPYRSWHVIGGVRWQRSVWRVFAEGYFQHLFRVPVEREPSAYSLLNEGFDLNRFWPGPLVNRGRGVNTGIDLGAEYFFGKNVYGFMAVSLYDSRYQASDGKWYPTVFNGRYALKGVVVWEPTVRSRKKERMWLPAIGLRVTWLGNKRYTPIDTQATVERGELVWIDSLAYSLQLPPYFRLDVKLRLRVLGVRVQHEWGLDLVNLTNHRNVFMITYTGGNPPLRYVYQIGFLPIFYYRVRF